MASRSCHFLYICRMKKLLAGISFFLILLSASRYFINTNQVVSTNIYQEDCPPEGSAQTSHLIALNKLKNRSQIPSQTDFDQSITLKKLLEVGDDTKRWNHLKAAKITGYVYDVKPGGVETCNCKTKVLDERDTHIELLADPMNDKKMLRMIVEVTPHMRKLMEKSGEGWSTKTLRDKLLGRWVSFSGWLLFDEEHANQAENTNPGRERNWRATAWEIHPVTKIEITAKPKE